MPKALATLDDGRTLLEHCLDSVAAAQAAGALDLIAIAVVVPAQPDAASALEDVCRTVTERTGITVLCVPGGAERADSVRAGLTAVRALADAGVGAAAGPGAGEDHRGDRNAVLVHDAARPFVPPAVFHAVVAALSQGAAAAVPGVPVVDTIKTVTSAVPGSEHVSGTLDRATLRAVQTPQGFDLASLETAHRRAERADAAVGVGSTGAAALTDDAMAMEAAGHPVAVVPGDPLGFKITTQLDLILANALLASSALSPDSPSPQEQQS